MTEKTIRFGKFEFPIHKGLEYLVNERLSDTDFLLINEPGESFSMTFEKDFPIFTVPENSERDYCLFELKRKDRIIRFFCPEKRANLDTAIWYFYVELQNGDGKIHSLPGQVRVEFDGDSLRRARGKPKFIELLEGVRIAQTPL